MELFLFLSKISKQAFFRTNFLNSSSALKSYRSASVRLDWGEQWKGFKVKQKWDGREKVNVPHRKQTWRCVRICKAGGEVKGWGPSGPSSSVVCLRLSGSALRLAELPAAQLGPRPPSGPRLTSSLHPACGRARLRTYLQGVHLSARKKHL